MNKNLSVLVGFSLTMVASGLSSAQDAPMTAQLEPPPTRSVDHYGMGFRMGFNIKADFTHSGSFSPQGHVVPIPGRGLELQPANPDGNATGDRTYEDGYVWKDSSGNAFGFSR